MAVERLTLKRAREIAGTLGFPSKLPGSSYGLPVWACRAGAHLAKIPGSVCSACYAARDQMSWPNPQKAQHRRLAAMDRPEWIAAIVRLLTDAHKSAFRRIDLGLRPGPKLMRLGSRHRLNEMGWHRWFDTGDLQSVEHLAKIIEVCRQTPNIRHWLPTRETAILRAYTGPIPDNLTIRVSGTMIDGPAPHGWSCVSTVHSDVAPEGAHVCPAPNQSHRCMSCRACWSRDVAHVSYREH